MIVEHHDNEVGHEKGTLLGRVGHNGTVECPYQAEMWAQEMLGGKTHRIYVHDWRTVLAVFACENDATNYVARASDWCGEWQLPFLTNSIDVATAIMGPEPARLVHNLEEAAEWAKMQLRAANIATAVILDADGVVVAYERGPDGPQTVAKGPRPFPIRAAA